MKLNIFLVITLFACGSVVRSFCQTAETAKSPAPEQSAAKQRTPEGLVRADFIFPGGSVHDLLSQMSQVFDVKLHDKVDLGNGNAQGVRIPKFSLKNATYPYAFSTLNTLADKGVENLGKWILVPVT